MTGSDGHVEQVAGAPRQQPQPQHWAQPQQSQPQDPSVGLPGWRPEVPPDDGGGVRRRLDPPPPVTAAAVLAIVIGTLLLVLAVTVFTGSAGPYLSAFRLVFPAILLIGGVLALRGRRGALTTGAVFLLITGIVLVVQVLGSDLYDSPAATIEAGLRISVGVLVLVFSRVPASTTYFETMQELRYGPKDADFFR